MFFSSDGENDAGAGRGGRLRRFCCCCCRRPDGGVAGCLSGCSSWGASAADRARRHLRARPVPSDPAELPLPPRWLWAAAATLLLCWLGAVVAEAELAESEEVSRVSNKKLF